MGGVFATRSVSRVALVLSIAGITGLGLYLTGRSSTPDRCDEPTCVIARVDGEPIERQELAQQATRERAAVVAYFRDRHGVVDEAGFWEGSFGGENPRRVLYARAREALVRRKVEQILMKEAGLIDDITLTGSWARWRAENDRREAATRAGQPVYGPRRFALAQYLAYEHSNGLSQLKRMVLTSSPPDDSVLRAFYAQHNDDRRYRGPTTVQVAMLVAAYGEERTRDAARALIHHARTQASSASMQVVAERLHVTYKAASFVDSDLGHGGNSLASLAMGLAQHTLSDPIDTGDSWTVMLLLDRASQVRTFEDSKAIIAAHYADEQFSSVLAKRVSSAHVESIFAEAGEP